MCDLDDLYLADPKLKPNPYALYARMRAESPVCRVRLHTTRAWVITRYEDVVAILKDSRVANDRRNARSEQISLHERVLHGLFAPVIYNMLGSDEPDHTRLRGLVSKAFTMKRVGQLRSRIETITQESLVRLLRQTQWDLVSDYALPLPTTIIAEMLGVPAADRDRFARWSNALLSSSATTVKGMMITFPKLMALLRYIRKLVRHRRRDPKDDLITALVQAEEAGDRLSEDELVSMIVLLLIAGFETTVNLISNGTLALLENPEQMERLRGDLSLMPLAVEEFVRYYTPIDYANSRWAKSDFELGGRMIRKGETVFACISSANRDERQFADPDKLDVCRVPNRHVGFGHGIHFCLGAFLAKLEAQVAFTTLLRECPNIALAVPRDTIRWRESFLLRGLQELPVSSVHAQAMAS